MEIIFKNNSNNLKMRVNLIFLLLALLLVPHFIRSYFNASSLALGVLFVTFFYFLYYIVISQRVLERMVGRKLFLSFVLFFCFVIFYAYYGSIFNNNSKPFNSLLFLFTMLVSYFIYILYLKIDFVCLYKVFCIVTFVLLFLGWASFLIEINIFNYGRLEKPVFPFLEESHYGLALGIFVVALSVVAGNRFFIFLFLNVLLLSLLFPNLTLLVFSFLALGAFFSKYNVKKLLLGYVFVFLIAVIVVLSFILKNEYFVSRLVLADTNNLTALVWIQGWDLAYLNFMQTYGLGLGFNSLGLEKTITSLRTDLIYNNTGLRFNLQDGGFLAAKLIGEFGLAGLLISLFYLVWVFGFLLKRNSISSGKLIDKSKIDLCKKRELLSGVVLGFFVEFFLRGYGYFSPTLLFFLASLFFIYKNGIDENCYY